MSYRARPRPRLRRGFTLVELLVVIMIIAMLMGMTSFAIWKVILRAREAAIAVEVDQLSQAMNSYKQDKIQYPPSMARISLTDRKQEFLRHISLAYTNANYGTTAANFDSLRAKIMTAGGSNWGYNYSTGSGSPVGLDLHKLDQAESLVFWLGGFPTPVTGTGPVAARRLFGFHRDEDNPFKRDLGFETNTPLQYRTDPRFNFVETRLTDADGDGWLEYAALAPRSGQPNAPFVYFDSYTYGTSTNSAGGFKHYCYPRYDDNGAASSQAQIVAEQFGMATPLATMIDSSKVQTTRWANPTGVQIISGGLDGKYGPSISGVALNTSQRAMTFPAGQNYYSTDGFGAANGMSREDFDNLTNLSERNLEGARAGASQ